MEQRYYWIKLRTNFFNREDIDFLLSQQNGCEYVVLYQMLCLMSANSCGKLETKINEIIVPYDVEKIARDTKYFDIDTVRVALELYKKLGLVYEDTNRTLSLIGTDELVGSESKWAEKKRIYREKQKQIECEDTVRTLSDKSIEYRDKIIDINKKENIKEKSAYGEFENVLLTNEEYRKLEDSNLLLYIDKLSNYIASKGKKYKSHYATILTWARKEEKEKLPEWFNKTRPKEKITKEERQELEEMFKEFKE